MAQNVDGKQFYGYLFEADKKPTKVLDALLRGIAIYIVSCDQLTDICVIIEGCQSLRRTAAEYLDRK